MLLERNLVQLIQWPLTSPLPPDYLLGKVPSLNEFLDKDSEDEMRGFVLDSVKTNEGVWTPLGGKACRCCWERQTRWRTLVGRCMRLLHQLRDLRERLRQSPVLLKALQGQ
jgi:hypothetical protein